MFLALFSKDSPGIKFKLIYVLNIYDLGDIGEIGLFIKLRDVNSLGDPKS